MGLWRFLWTTFVVACDCLFQKFFMLSVPTLEKIGGNVHGLTCIVTGPTSGIGRQTALELARRGANVILACRSEERGQELRRIAVEAAFEAGVEAPSIEVMILDLATLASVRDFASSFKATGRPLHILVNNAGIFDIGGSRKKTVDGFEQHMGVNFLAPFLLTMLLLPVLQQSSETGAFGARIVSVSSLMHIKANLSPADVMLQRSYNSSTAYSNSKSAQVLFTRALRQHIHSSKLQVFAVHPGEVLSDIARGIHPMLYRIHKAVSQLYLLTPPQGARSTIHCATSPIAPRQADRSFGYFDSNTRPKMPSPSSCDDTLAEFLLAYATALTDAPDVLNIMDTDAAGNPEVIDLT